MPQDEPASGAQEKPLFSSAHDVAEALRGQIQSNALPPGQWLREVRLCDAFGVGRSIIRTALRTLADDGLLVIEQNRGARVSATTIEEVFDLYEVRAALYGLAARFACMRATDAAIAAMIEQIDAMLALAEGDAAPETIIEASEAIFSQMATSASADARRMIESIRRKTRWHFTYGALASSAGGPGPYRFWHSIRDALHRRDADQAGLGAQELIRFMQGEATRVMLARGTAHIQSNEGEGS